MARIWRCFGRLTAFVGVALVAVCGSSENARGQGFPRKPVHMVVGYGPGGGTDIVARVISGKLGDALGQPVIVENRPGADSIVGAVYVAKAAADGHTILVGPSGPMAVNPAIYAKLPYSPVRDFVPISMIGTTPLVLVVNASLPVKSVRELIDYAKAKPGALNYASAYATSQLAAELFNQRAGTRFLHIPYKSSAEATQALISGHVSMVAGDLKAMSAAVKAGTIRALALLHAQRHPKYRDIPSIGEAGFPDVQVSAFQGLFAPAGTPPGIVQVLQEAVARVIKLPEIHQRLDDLGMDPGSSTSEQFARVLAADIAKWSAVAKAANIKAD